MNGSIHTNTVSVIIPAFNAQKFIRNAINSALQHLCVKEIIVIDDGSNDNTYEICKNIAKNENKVKVLQHKRGENRGAGESRNCGIKYATGEYISFLDADDLYLNNRFDKALDLLKENVQIDGVYEVLGVEYYDNVSKGKHIKRMKVAKKNIKKTTLPLDFTGITPPPSPKSLFRHLLITDLGWIHLNCLTIRSVSLRGFNLFNREILGEDSEFITRLSCERTLVGTNSLEPVAIRGVHEMNRITNQKIMEAVKPKTDWVFWLVYALKHQKYDAIKYIILRASDSASKLIKIINIAKIFYRYPKSIIHFFKIQ